MPSEFFAGRRTRPAHELRGPRVYSTDLHPNLFSPTPLDKQILTTALSLKAKIITRGLVTINGAHFLSPQAIRFFAEHPDFIECPNIVTAFREDKKDFGDFVSNYEKRYQTAGITSAELNAHVDLLNEKVTTLLPWKLEDVGEKYRTLVLRGLQNPNSSIRHRLMNDAGLDDTSMNTLIQKLREEVNLSDHLGMQTYLEEQSKEVQEHLRPFTTSCYHIIGVGVVNCETGTDLQPLADYKAEEMLRNDVEDSNYDEFGVFRRFYEIAMEAIDASIMPESVLRALTFEDASRFGTRLHESEFVPRYESVIQRFAEGLKQKSDAAAIEQLDIEAFTNDIEELSRLFEEEIDKELDEYKTKYQDEKRSGVVAAIWRAKASTPSRSSGTLKPSSKPPTRRLISLRTAGSPIRAEPRKWRSKWRVKNVTKSSRPSSITQILAKRPRFWMPRRSSANSTSSAQAALNRSSPRGSRSVPVQ